MISKQEATCWGGGEGHRNKGGINGAEDSPSNCDNSSVIAWTKTPTKLPVLQKRHLMKAQLTFVDVALQITGEAVTALWSHACWMTAKPLNALNFHPLIKAALSRNAGCREEHAGITLLKQRSYPPVAHVSLHWELSGFKAGEKDHAVAFAIGLPIGGSEGWILTVSRTMWRLAF